MQRVKALFHVGKMPAKCAVTLRSKIAAGKLIRTLRKFSAPSFVRYPPDCKSLDKVLWVVVKSLN